MPIPLSEDDERYLSRTFVYHAPKGDQPIRYQELRNQAYELATIILQTTPSSRERSLALTKLEETIFWANAAIARNE